MEKFKIITNNKNWIESSAVKQLENISKYKGVLNVIGLPDLHPGRTPVGVAVMTQGHIYPFLIGGDIGCGMGFFKTGISLKKFKIEKWQNRLNNIIELNDVPYINDFNEKSPIPDLGTIGGGNHFAEFQRIERVYDNKEYEKLNIYHEDIFLLVHSGSRSYGAHILSKFNNETGYEDGSNEAKEYIKYHDHASLWAKRNREIVANKLISWLGFESYAERIIDCTHNYLEKYDDKYIHRKGATSSANGVVVIPGSRGTFTYIVKPIGDGEESCYSISHGAGRKWARSLCKSRIRDKYTHESIRYTSLKSRVICHDTQLLYEEAPEAYKKIEDIIDVLIEYKLIKVVATLRPLITFKG